jgi:hypothetical protein
MANVWSSRFTLKVFLHNGLRGSGNVQLRNDIIHFLWAVGESIPSVKYAEVVHILNVALLEVEAEGEPFAEEV